MPSRTVWRLIISRTKAKQVTNRKSQHSQQRHVIDWSTDIKLKIYNPLRRMTHVSSVRREMAERGCSNCKENRWIVAFCVIDLKHQRGLLTDAVKCRVTNHFTISNASFRSSVHQRNCCQHDSQPPTSTNAKQLTNTKASNTTLIGY